MALADIDTFVVVMMENRSFDHMLGYLSLATTPSPLRVEGLSSDPAWLVKFSNPLGGTTLPPTASFRQQRRCLTHFAIMHPSRCRFRRRQRDRVQLRWEGSQKAVRFSESPPPDPQIVSGLFRQGSCTHFRFFARNYCVCDHWFSAVPLGTQANRLMAMAGESLVLDNAPLLLPEQPLVYDWLTDHDVTWCAYQSGDFLPFFSLMPKWLPEMGASLTASGVVGGRGRFRRYARLRSEWRSSEPMPSVIFIEPEYTDGPHASPNDDHPPTGIAAGQEFLADIYDTLTSNPARWAKTMLIVTYDEHGGFFDHLPPIPIPATIDGQKLSTTGVRVPAFVISPYVVPGRVFTGPLDHTSILQVLDDRFGGGPGYSVAVNERQTSLNRLLNTLLATQPNVPPRLPAPETTLVRKQGLPSAPDTANAQALHKAASKLADDHPDLIVQPGWEKLREYLATTPEPQARPTR
jgi:phospholipase C